MSDRGGWLKGLVAVACLVGSALAIYNVNFDVTPLQKEAEQLACGVGGCAQAIGISRSPIAQVFTFQIQKNSAETERVECARSLLLLGAYSCKRVPK